MGPGDKDHPQHHPSYPIPANNATQLHVLNMVRGAQTPSVYATVIVGILPGPHRRETGCASRNLAQRWLFRASAEGLGDLSRQTVSIILALAIAELLPGFAT